MGERKFVVKQTMAKSIICLCWFTVQIQTKRSDALVVGISSDMSLPNILKPLFLHHNTHATLEISSEVEK